ncbi:hypothetical protein DYB37_004945 [Aphanomyces astaci]|uniref:Helicase-associated domain-containing protein n=1 Tax=Aphanomyces astaci TaxID=112090 RepID=A0A397ET41_APHAT|nr:hypothetical protein DYB35_006626 [Aphanomyces astaci]RHY99909.1 hypothetical protein DYB31_014596 [Aphanomyces astaci]RHZ11230.1 hypothetical protein DYB26_014571 [Aphanomyces astaci]RHZ31021.1 hypothetical protein DYB37_004945 [Aphanomyces astaci]
MPPMLSSCCHRFLSSNEDILSVARVLHAKSPTSFTVLPSTYVVPDHDDYPIHLRGKSLAISELRRQYKNHKVPSSLVEQFDALSFVWDVNFHKSALRLQALTVYKELHGDLNVPRHFKVPAGDSRWLVDTWGLSLGAAVHNMRTGHLLLHPGHEASFLALGFTWDVKNSQWDDHLEALVQYIRLHEHSHVPLRFVVPVDDPDWPVHMRGIPLGRVAASWRQLGENAMPADRRAALNALDFVWNAWDHQWTRNMDALTAYVKQHGDLLVPKRFVVPDDDPSYPEHTRGLALGSLVHSTRNRMDDLPRAHHDALDHIGMVWDPLDYHWDHVVLALRTHERLHGHLRIATKFKVPCGDPHWPKDTWGLHLGSLVTQIRHRAVAMAIDQVDLLAMIVRQDEQDELENDTNSSLHAETTTSSS